MATVKEKFGPHVPRFAMALELAGVPEDMSAPLAVQLLNTAQNVVALSVLAVAGTAGEMDPDQRLNEPQLSAGLLLLLALIGKVADSPPGGDVLPGITPELARAIRGAVNEC